MDELRSDPRSMFESTDRTKSRFKQSRSIDELSKPNFIPPPLDGLSQVAPDNDDELDECNYSTIDGSTVQRNVLNTLDSGIFVPTQVLDA